ncbi:hypothetical protein ACFSTH_02435 [Paenibacillus yanchengensis]|uniref:Glycoside hydrolase family 2 immunoglobulin-like beta-sandwich domain-containing protein n=1 Tax=Paenibacillus yanchengensis TaxID=2035833 RepID=A0ABW4YGE2_9BACL
MNGSCIRSHKGGFTTWDCDITAHVMAGKQTEIIVEFMDNILDPSVGSYYAHHNIGGIINSVELIAVPHTHITKLHYDVQFDADYTDAELTVMLGVELGSAEQAVIQLKLLDPEQHTIPLDEAVILFDSQMSLQKKVFSIANPIKWDAEHPHLYTLRAKLYRDVA